MRSLLTICCFSFFLASASAQIRATGVIEPIPGGPCGLGETHRLECTELYLKSSAIDLSQYEGITVTVDGNEVGTPACRVWEVSSVANANVTLNWFGNAIPGGPVYFEVFIHPPGGSHIFEVYASTNRTIQPHSLAVGTIFLLPPYQPACSGVADPFGICAVLLPSKSSLSGTQIYAQVLGFHNHPELSNVICIDVL